MSGHNSLSPRSVSRWLSFNNPTSMSAQATTEVTSSSLLNPIQPATLSSPESALPLLKSLSPNYKPTTTQERFYGQPLVDYKSDDDEELVPISTLPIQTKSSPSRSQNNNQLTFPHFEYTGQNTKARDGSVNTQFNASWKSGSTFGTLNGPDTNLVKVKGPKFPGWGQDLSSVNNFGSEKNSYSRFSIERLIDNDTNNNNGGVVEIDGGFGYGIFGNKYNKRLINKGDREYWLSLLPTKKIKFNGRICTQLNTDLEFTKEENYKDGVFHESFVEECSDKRLGSSELAPGSGVGVGSSLKDNGVDIIDLTGDSDDEESDEESVIEITSSPCDSNSNINKSLEEQESFREGSLIILSEEEVRFSIPDYERDVNNDYLKDISAEFEGSYQYNHEEFNNSRFESVGGDNDLSFGCNARQSTPININFNSLNYNSGIHDSIEFEKRAEFALSVGPNFFDELIFDEEEIGKFDLFEVNNNNSDTRRGVPSNLDDYCGYGPVPESENLIDESDNCYIISDAGYTNESNNILSGDGYDFRVNVKRGREEDVQGGFVFKKVRQHYDDDSTPSPSQDRLREDRGVNYINEDEDEWNNQAPHNSPVNNQYRVEDTDGSSPSYKLSPTVVWRVRTLRAKKLYSISIIASRDTWSSNGGVGWQ